MAICEIIRYLVRAVRPRRPTRWQFRIAALFLLTLQVATYLGMVVPYVYRPRYKAASLLEVQVASFVFCPRIEQEALFLELNPIRCCAAAAGVTHGEEIQLEHSVCSVLSFTGEDPVLAARTVNAFVDAFLSQGTEAWVETYVGHLESECERCVNDLASIASQHPERVWCVPDATERDRTVDQAIRVFAAGEYEYAMNKAQADSYRDWLGTQRTASRPGPGLESHFLQRLAEMERAVKQLDTARHDDQQFKERLAALGVRRSSSVDAVRTKAQYVSLECAIDRLSQQIDRLKNPRPATMWMPSTIVRVRAVPPSKPVNPISWTKLVLTFVVWMYLPFGILGAWKRFRFGGVFRRSESP